MRVGFTGSQIGMTEYAYTSLIRVLSDLAREHHEIEFHHGDCVGADYLAHIAFTTVAEDMMFPASIVIHPPRDPKKRAFCTGVKRSVVVPIRVTEVDDYLNRNQAIVDDTEILVACPATKIEHQRSGTWATIRRAIKAGREIIYVHNDGSVVRNHAA